jgi:DNA-binding response OmpR family regulator
VQQGELAFLQKPFSPSALAARVREVLDSKPAS